MKTWRAMIGLVILTALTFGATFTSFGQTNGLPRFSPNSLTRTFTNNAYALNVISNLLATPPAPLSVPRINRTNMASGGTYWIMTSPAPLPFNPFSDLSVYQLSTNPDFIIDDRSVDYGALELEEEAEGFTNQVQFSEALIIDTNSLYLQAPSNSVATPGQFKVILHNTIQGQSYDFLTKSDLLAPTWTPALTTTGAVGNATVVFLSESGHTNLFVWARVSTGISFYIDSAPINQLVEDGDGVTFSVGTGGNTNLTFQWIFNGSPIAGATNSSFSLNNVHDADGGGYAVKVSDGTNSVTTSAADLTTDSANDLGPTQTGDFNLIPILSSRQDYTFKNGITYYIASPISFYGQTTIEGGSIIKPDWFSGGSAQIMGTLTCKTEPYFPSVWTSVDDDAFGEPLGFSGSDGPPTPVPNGIPYLDLTFAQTNTTISNLRICFADKGLVSPVFSPALDVWDSQFFQCDTAIVNLGTGADNLHNVLFAECGSAFEATSNSITVRGEQVTADVSQFCAASNAPAVLALTNSIYWGTPLTAGTLSAVDVTHNPNGTNFSSEGYGFYYLAAVSSLHRAGSTNISPRLQSEFQHKTTLAPLPLPNGMTLSGSLTLGPLAARYTNGAPDLGYWYDAVDYTVANFTLAGGSLTILPDTSIALRNDFIASNSTYSIEGFFVHEGSTIVSHGSPTKPNTFTAEKMVQETPETDFAAFKNDSGWWFGAVVFVTDSEPTYENLAEASYDFRFCNFFLTQGDYHFWSGFDEFDDFELSPDSSMDLGLRDCQFHGGRIDLGNPDQSFYTLTQVYSPGSVSWVNNSFENVSINIDPTYYWYNGVVNCDMQLLAFNNLFQGGAYFRMEPIPASAGNWTFKDNLFDKVNFLQDTSKPLDYDYNGYWPLLPREYIYGGSSGHLATTTTDDGTTDGGHERALTNAPAYQTSTFGKFYLATNTPLYGAGSRTAAAAGLSQYCTRPDQIAERADTAKANVNIGIHYVAATGTNPKDTDGDGIPDFVEDANGNGIVDANETDPGNAMTDGLTNDIYNAAYADIDLSGDGLAGRVKAALGMNPLDTGNPLALRQVNDPEADIATFEIPVSYNVLTNAGNVNLFINGVNITMEDFGPATNGNTLVNWNTTYNTPGQHYLQAKLSLKASADDDAVLIGFGTLTPFYSDTLLQFFESDALYDAAGAFLDAQVLSQSANYTIQIFDPSTSPATFVKGITNSTANGIIQENWNLKYNDGVTSFTGDTFDAVFSVTLTGSGPTPHISPGSKQHTKRHTKIGTTEQGNGFDFTYLYTPRGSFFQEQFSDVDTGAVALGMQNVVDTLLMPVTVDGGHDDHYDSSFDRYTSRDFPGQVGIAGYLTSQTTVNNTLYPDMGNGTTKNFFTYAHGTGNTIGDYNLDVLLSAPQVATALTNFYSSQIIKVKNPYRFVFLDGCETASTPEWREAFGIEPLSATNQAARFKLGPQAFVGWANKVTGWLNPTTDSTLTENVASAYTEALDDMYELWMEERPLAQCIRTASSPAENIAPFPVPNTGIKFFHIFGDVGVDGAPYNYNIPLTNVLTSPIYIIGHSGLTRSGVNTGFDGLYKSPIDVP